MDPKVHYCTHKRPPPVPILCQPNPVHIPTSHLLEIHPNIIQPSTPRSPQWSLSLRFPHQDAIRPPLLTHTRHMPSPSHSSRFYHPHNIGWAVQIIQQYYQVKLLFVGCVSCVLVAHNVGRVRPGYVVCFNISLMPLSVGFPNRIYLRSFSVKTLFHFVFYLLSSKCPSIAAHSTACVTFVLFPEAIVKPLALIFPQRFIAKDM